MVAQHKPVLRAPYYADQEDGTLIHRYLDEDFVTRHLQAMQQGSLQGNRAQKWRFEDRFADDKNLPWLRLPVHRTFYMVSCEVVCDNFGTPPFNPQSITSAGFVVRRRDGSRWLQLNGVTQGWQTASQDQDDPDYTRQLRRQKLIRPRLPEPLPSGEETYPLHAQLVSADAADGRQRKHTLLYGFLPLSGSVQNELLKKRASADYFVDTLPWPFGRQDQRSDEVLVWGRGDGHLMQNGVAEPALLKLVNQLLSRYQLLDNTVNANKALHDFFSGVHFYRLPDSNRYLQTRQKLAQVAQRCGGLAEALALFPLGNVGDTITELKTKQSRVPGLAYPAFAEAEDFAAARLAADTTQALQWLAGVSVLARSIQTNPTAHAALSALLSAVNSADASLHALQSYLSDLGNFQLQSLQRYFNANKVQLLAKASSDEDMADLFVNVAADSQLFFSEAQAMQLRELLFDRSTALTKDYVDSLQIPRYQQNPDDIYYIKPFVRYLDAHGCEQIVWGGNSEPFRVAAPFDPEASRPQAIQMPKLSDLKRGLAKGATFVAPKDLAAQLKKIGMEMPPTEKSGNSFGLEWIISFSLPVITICAMLLLMIVLNLLNLFFQWLPYAITLIPKPK
ncbi:hypothetical protein [Methylomonas methanica]|uniref:Uncharacterized protein n=1 Tax=Methylomonas methanica (strain DSM 25384 / MC09) TaxID=857087 RepID=F9ZW26_METMM|nr:hypothetical protein [Methylomonas methanica]AEG00830.1 hypothetical protein Metme_2432 [Methylomonas methanica MC09]